MGLFNFLKNKVETYRYAQALNGYTPIFSQFGQDIYASDIVEGIASCLVAEISKLQPLHVIKNGRDQIPVNDSIQYCLNHPNELMTTYDMLSKISYNLFINLNAFIYPMFETRVNSDGSNKRTCKGFYPLQPINVEMLEDASGQLFYRMRFASGYETTLPKNAVIHIKDKYFKSDFMGGDEQGQPNNKALLKLLQMNNNLMEGVLNAMKCSYNINGLLKYNTLLDDKKMQSNIDDFNKQIANNESGILGLDLKGEFIPITRKIQAVDPETLKFVDTRLLRNFRVGMSILMGDYTKAQYQAFYQAKLEPWIINISQAFSEVLFTEREKQLGHGITLMTEPLLFMDTTQVLEAIRLLGDSGGLWENEKRIAIGMPPDPALVGVRMQSLNYVNVEIASQYQAGNPSESKESDSKPTANLDDVDPVTDPDIEDEEEDDGNGS